MKKKILPLLLSLSLILICCKKNQTTDENFLPHEQRSFDLGLATVVLFKPPYVFVTSTYDPILGVASLNIPTLQDGKMFEDGIYDVMYTGNVVLGTGFPDFSPAYRQIGSVNFKAGKGILPLNGLFASSYQTNFLNIKIFFKILAPANPTPNQSLFSKQEYSIAVAKRPEFTPILTCSQAAYTPSWTSNSFQTGTFRFTVNSDTRLLPQISTANSYTLHSALVTNNGVTGMTYEPPTAQVRILANGNIMQPDGVTPFQQTINTAGMGFNQAWTYHAYLQQNGNVTTGTLDILAVCSNLTFTPSL